jgi:hypothetical protein
LAPTDADPDVPVAALDPLPLVAAAPAPIRPFMSM